MRPRRQPLEARTQITDSGGKHSRGKAADDAENGVRDQFGWTLEFDGRNAEQRFRAEEPAHHHDTGDGREHDGAEDAGGPTADDLFNDEQDGGDRRIECGSKASCRADRSDEPHAVAGKAHAGSDRRGNAGADLQGWIFGAERESCTYGEGRGDELADGGAEGNVAVEDVERGLGLIDAAAARQMEDVNDHFGDDKAG